LGLYSETEHEIETWCGLGEAFWSWIEKRLRKSLV